MELKGRSILITGGTGSLGKAITKYLVNNHDDIKRLVIFSRDEQKQYEMELEFSEKEYPFMRYFIGDVRDLDRLKRAFQGIDYVIHAAAMKHVHIAEYNPTECISTNVKGAENVIQAALDTQVSRVVALSTDKACAPINLYGATKLTSDKLFVAANNIKGSNPINFSVVRYGNVMGSNGSVIPFFLKMKKAKGELPITHSEMTRFNIPIESGVEMIFHALENAYGGEIFIPKIPSYRILDVANAIGPTCKKPIIGIRPGEKIHEEMITPADSYNTYDLGRYYVILPNKVNWNIEEYLNVFSGEKVQEGFKYNSEENSQWEDIESLRFKIKKYLDKDFTYE
jgi:UDP-N-acetylglucosamine 4,6-dehydratase (inverting)